MSLEQLVSSLSIEEKVGQLLMVGVPSSELDGSTRAVIKDLGVGGVILYRRNIKRPDQLRALVEAL